MVHPVSPAELAALLQTPGIGGIIDVIDVRDPSEWDAGHIDGARLVPLEQLRADPDAVLARDTQLIFVCAKGVRSMQAAKLAERFGYERVRNLEGGTKEWERSGLPLVSAARVAA